MSKTSIKVWDYGQTKKIKIHKNGTINSNAIQAYKNGNCHSLAVALHKITGWPIYGFVDQKNSITDPGHVVVRNPKNGGYLDIQGYGAATRWRKRWGPITIHPLTAYQAEFMLDSYMKADCEKAMPFAAKLLEKIGVKI